MSGILSRLLEFGNSAPHTITLIQFLVITFVISQVWCLSKFLFFDTILNAFVKKTKINRSKPVEKIAIRLYDIGFKINNSLLDILNIILLWFIQKFKNICIKPLFG